MNKIALRSALGCLIAWSAYIDDAKADTVSIAVTGTITDSTCALVGNDGNQTIAMDKINAGVVTAATGAVTSYKKPFSIALQNCTAGLSSAIFSFAGTVGTPSSVLVNTGSAKGVGLEMSLDDGSNTIVTPNTGTYPVTIGSDNKAQINLSVRYYHLPGVPVAGGSVGAISTFTVTYR